MKKHLGKVIRSVRTATGSTQESVAERANTTANYMSLIERGVQQPTVFKLYKIAEALDMTASDLLRLVDASIAGRLETVVREKQ